MSESSLEGGCLCGQVRYKVSGEPLIVGHCHCTSCRKLSGAGHMTNAMYPKNAISVDGTVSDFQWAADSGKTVTTSFCTNCGSHLFGRTESMPDGIAVRVASLDDPNAVPPQITVYQSRLLDWDHLATDIPHFPEMPPNF